ncbi:hypothetical protein [Streptomyces sp. P3]|nr:hypothetical protein [Streptomyces sp. P3]
MSADRQGCVMWLSISGARAGQMVTPGRDSPVTSNDFTSIDVF